MNITSHHSCVICPHCGYKHMEDLEYYTSEEPARKTCDVCGKTFLQWSETGLTHYAMPIGDPSKAAEERGWASHILRRWHERILPALAATWLIAQLGPDGTSARCWIMRGVQMRAGDTERHWLATRPEMDGWLQRVEVRGGDVDAAARELGLRDAKGCKG